MKPLTLKAKFIRWLLRKEWEETQDRIYDHVASSGGDKLFDELDGMGRLLSFLNIATQADMDFFDGIDKMARTPLEVKVRLQIAKEDEKDLVDTKELLIEATETIYASNTMLDGAGCLPSITAYRADLANRLIKMAKKLTIRWKM